MSYLTNPYMVAPTGGGAIYGTHWYQFGGKGGVDGTDEQITEQELGTDTATGTAISTLSTPRRLGCNAQTATEIYTMGGSNAYEEGVPVVAQTDIEEYTVGSAVQSAHKSDLEIAVTYIFNHGYNTTYAYVMGGTTLSALKTEIQQYEMGTGSAVNSPANLEFGVWGNAGGTNSTYCYSYTGSGTTGASRTNYIQTYEMEVDTTASQTGDTDPARYGMGGSSQSTTTIVGYGGDAA